MEKIYDLEEHLVRFAGEAILFATTGSGFAAEYYRGQVIRSSGSNALHYGEAQGTKSKKDYRHKLRGVLKELKESRTAYRIMQYVSIGNKEKLSWLLSEAEELIAITNTLIAKNQD